MKTLLTILILAVSLTTACKKQNKKPDPPPPPPVICTDKAPAFVGAYYTYNTGSVDTCYITLIENNCKGKTRWKIDSLSNVFMTWAVSIEDRDYVVPSQDEYNGSSDSIVVKFNNNTLQVSAKVNGTFTPYLNLKRRI